MEGDLTLGGKHNVIYIWFIIELYNWNLYNFINQCNSNKFKEEKYLKSMNFVEVS